jgi:MFS family permease
MKTGSESSSFDPKHAEEESDEGPIAREHHGDYGSMEVPISSSVRLYAICAAFNSCNFGYDIGVSTNMGPLLQEDFGLTNPEREMLIGCLNFFAMFGALASSAISDRFGRRATFVVASFGFLNGLMIMAMGHTYKVVFIGRMLVGLGCGIGFAVDPLCKYSFE